MKVLAPGKIILSGEHAVVYGKPALVMAVDRFAQAQSIEEQSCKIKFDCPDIGISSETEPDAISKIASLVEERYLSFVHNKSSENNTLTTPMDAYIDLLHILIQEFDVKIQKGLHIKLSSQIPIGSGMGSSAATLVSVFKLMTEFFSLNFEKKRFLDFVLRAENFYHGYSSGVDPYISFHGGFIRYQNRDITDIPMPNLPAYVVFTGKPESTTSDCVSQVATQFKNDSVWQDFESTTCALEQAILENNLNTTRALIKKNHQLLVEIGVVPLKIQSFIKDIEKTGASAKISGAGAIKGENAGMVLIFDEEPPKKICEHYNYPWFTLKGEANGARIV